MVCLRTHIVSNSSGIIVREFLHWSNDGAEFHGFRFVVIHGTILGKIAKLSPAAENRSFYAAAHYTEEDHSADDRTDESERPHHA